MPPKTIFQRPGDPYLYLWVMGDWYCYDPLTEPLGSGAMGTVYKGYKVEDGTPVAIKRVRDQFSNNPMIRARAKQEASLAFRHDNLIEMIGYCEAAPSNGPIFLVSKFVEGCNIDDYIKKREESVITESFNRTEFITDAVCKVLDALEYVHSRGVVHRDIKPSNIMVEDGANIRLMDLGIARMNDGNSFSKFGFIGTPQYSAPEQILREKTGIVQINASTDIYALGITYYELLTGNNPYYSEVDADILTRQLREPLPKDKLIPKRLMNVLWKATEKEQSKRYSNATEFKDAIRMAMSPSTSIFTKLLKWFSK